MKDEYSNGWCDGCKYGEGLARGRALIGGVFIGLAIACALAALVTYFGGIS